MGRKRQKVQKSMQRKIVIFVFCVGIISIFFPLSARAEENASILQYILTEEGIDLYISGLGEYDQASGQIGREPVEVVQTGQDTAGHTIILLDNSLSVTKDNMGKAKEILKKYAEAKKESEKVSLAVYGTDIQYLIEKETDKDKIIEAADSVASEDKDTYLTDVLYDELVKLGSKTEYTRFIVITDGVDNKEIGYTKEELSAYLKDNPYPVYTLGCKYKNNEEELKNLFAISRLTNGKYYLLDDYEEMDEIVEGFCEPVTGITIKVPEGLRDGSVKNVLLSFQTGDGTAEVTAELAMPFGLKAGEESIIPPESGEEGQTEEQKPEKEEPPEKSDPEEEAREEEPEAEEGVEQKISRPEEDMPGEEPAIDIVSIAAAVMIGIALIVLLIMNRKKKGENKGKSEKKGRGKNNFPQEEKRKRNAEIESEEDNGSTVMVQEDSGLTEFLGQGGRAGYIVALKDCNDTNKVFRYPLSGKVVIGRMKEGGVNLVLSDDRTLSAKHCEISVREGRFFIKDLHSSNGTFLDGKKLPPNEVWEFAPGSRVRMGNREMIIEVEQLRNGD